MPPASMITKDFLRQILNGEKKMIKNADIKTITVPKYDELSVINLLPKVKENVNVMIYFPDRLPKGKTISREYFFNVLNTSYPDYLQKMIDHANNQRMGSANNGTEMDEIKVTDDMWNELNAMPFFSSKCQPNDVTISMYRKQGQDATSAEVRGEAEQLWPKAQAIRALQRGAFGGVGAHVRVKSEQVPRGGSRDEDGDGPVAIDVFEAQEEQDSSQCFRLMMVDIKIIYGLVKELCSL